jgi:hypothetical protein
MNGRRAYSHADLEPFERIMRLALKVQSQRWATVETLAAVKNPPMLFAKQANVTSGPQQVNNRIAVPMRSRAPENEIGPTELLERKRGDEWLDGGAAGAAGEVDTSAEAVGAVNRAKDG